jgi:hypothetical protein
MMRNVYSVKLAKPVGMVPGGAHFSGNQTSWLYVAASTFHDAEQAVLAKYPAAEIRGIDLLNYSGVPIVVGD